jgi:hypothetical protein
VEWSVQARRFKSLNISSLGLELAGRFCNQLFGEPIVTFFVTLRMPKSVVKTIVYGCDSGTHGCL